MTSITDRRNFLTVAGGLAATIATSLAIAASPGACAVQDPIYAAIDAHQAAARAYDVAFELSWPHSKPEPCPGMLKAAADVEGAAIDRVINTAPTTRWGLEALANYLAEPRSGCIAGIINYRLQQEGHMFKLNPDKGYFNLAVARKGGVNELAVPGSKS
jgi:hypothetical protein